MFDMWVSRLRRYIIVLPILITLFIALSINNFVMDEVKTPKLEEDNLLSTVDFCMNNLNNNHYILSNETYLYNSMISLSVYMDNLFGVACGLYKINDNCVDTIVVCDRIPDSDCPGLPENYFRLDNMKFHETDFLVGNYSYFSDSVMKGMEHKFYYCTFRDYVILWGVRPDLVNKYFINYSIVLQRIMLSLFVIIMVNVIAFAIKNEKKNDKEYV